MRLHSLLARGVLLPRAGQSLADQGLPLASKSQKRTTARRLKSPAKLPGAAGSGSDFREAASSSSSAVPPAERSGCGTAAAVAAATLGTKAQKVTLERERDQWSNCAERHEIKI